MNHPSSCPEDRPGASSSAEEENSKSEASEGEAEKVEISGSEASEGEGESEDDSDDSNFVESLESHKRKRTKAANKPTSSSSSKAKSSSNIVEKRRKRTPISRLISVEDEIAILKGLREWKRKGWFPLLAGQEFTDYVKDSLHFNPVNKSQVVRQVWQLKKRFCKFLEKKNDDDADPVFEDPNDYKLYLIMKDIWGDEYPVIRKKNVKYDDDDDNLGRNGNGREVKAKRELLDKLPVLGITDCISEEGLKLIGDAKVKKFEKKWKKLHQEELHLNLKRTELMEEMTQALLAAVKALKD
ncbi:uncharacterized protein LOC113279610 [Papaver somniferum]|uniref:uncharacterized protein LOC113279610 n=1 Tax=Papaver somniferum TaxID=3469 RepID=UPI000E6F8C5E|nr:uncharacterized protein LOC113279610 [Papaver somniferum]